MHIKDQFHGQLCQHFMMLIQCYSKLPVGCKKYTFLTGQNCMLSRGSLWPYQFMDAALNSWTSTQRYTYSNAGIRRTVISLMERHQLCNNPELQHGHYMYQEKEELASLNGSSIKK